MKTASCACCTTQILFHSVISRESFGAGENLCLRRDSLWFSLASSRRLIRGAAGGQPCPPVILLSPSQPPHANDSCQYSGGCRRCQSSVPAMACIHLLHVLLLGLLLAFADPKYIFIPQRLSRNTAHSFCRLNYTDLAPSSPPTTTSTRS